MIFTMITEQESLLPFYITGMGIQKNQENIRRPEGLHHYQWSFCSKGKGVFRGGDQEVEIGVGQGFYFCPGMAHEYYALDEPWEIYWITFNGNRIEEFMSLLKFGRWGIFQREPEREFLNEFRQVYQLLESDSLNKILDSSSYLYSLLVHLRKDEKRPLAEEVNDPLLRLQPVIHYMEKNLASDIELEQLSEILGITGYHLCRLFKASFSVAPIHYLMKLRMQEAKKKLIMEGDKEVKEIAKEVGYPDISYFGKLFKKHEGVSAKKFRSLHGVGPR